MKTFSLSNDFKFQSALRALDMQSEPDELPSELQLRKSAMGLSREEDRYCERN